MWVIQIFLSNIGSHRLQPQKYWCHYEPSETHISGILLLKLWKISDVTERGVIHHVRRQQQQQHQISLQPAVQLLLRPLQSQPPRRALWRPWFVTLVLKYLIRRCSLFFHHPPRGWKMHAAHMAWHFESAHCLPSAKFPVSCWDTEDALLLHLKRVTAYINVIVVLDDAVMQEEHTASWVRFSVLFELTLAE